MAKLRTPLCEALGLRTPIIQAPMAGGPSTPALVAACTKAGALGSFGHAYTQPEGMRKDVAAVRAQTDAPININLFAAPLPPAIAAEAQQAAITALAPYYEEVGLPPPAPVAPPFAPELERQLDTVMELRPAVVTLHLGNIDVERIRAFQRAGIRVGTSATCVAEAQEAEARGIDFIVAQGAEAGGHRGTYLREPFDAMTGTFAIVRMLVRAVRTPVVAAGGIMDGAGIAAALALGAQAAQLGTAFLPCAESGAPAIHKRLLLEAREDTTLVTTRFSGKPARGLANRYIRETTDRAAAHLPFPAQNMLAGKLRAKAAQDGNPDFIAMWAGQAAPLARALPAAELIAALEAETLQAIERLARLQA